MIEIFQAIEENESVAKAWFRRGEHFMTVITTLWLWFMSENLGEAHLALNDCEAAKADFERTFQLDPENKVLSCSIY